MIDDLNKEIYSLENENLEIRERLNILETLTGKDSQAVVQKLKDLGGKSND